MKIEVTQGPDNAWFAIDLDNYEAESDVVGSWSNSPQGIGDTEIEAVRDLLNQIEERANARAPKREENDDVFPGFRGNNDYA